MLRLLFSIVALLKANANNHNLEAKQNHSNTHTERETRAHAVCRILKWTHITWNSCSLKNVEFLCASLYRARCSTISYIASAKNYDNNVHKPNAPLSISILSNIYSQVGNQRAKPIRYTMYDRIITYIAKQINDFALPFRRCACSLQEKYPIGGLQFSR